MRHDSWRFLTCAQPGPADIHQDAKEGNADAVETYLAAKPLDVERKNHDDFGRGLRVWGEIIVYNVYVNSRKASDILGRIDYQ